MGIFQFGIMAGMQKISWWKWLGAILVFISLMVGLVTPLAPGILDYSPKSLVAGKRVLLRVNTVNAHFNTHHENLQAVLSFDKGALIKAEQITVVADNVLDLGFKVPLLYKPRPGHVNLLDLEIASDYDGLLVIRQGIKLSPPIQNDVKPTEIPSGISGLSQTLKIKRIEPTWFSFPYREILYESIRNLFFHVVMWFAMLILFLVSVVYSIRYLRDGNPKWDIIASESVGVGLVFAIIGIVTGSLWAKYTWGDWWPNDPKLNGTAIAVLLYFAYVILRNSITEADQRAKISAVYNVFSFPLMFVVIMILPRITASLHPGNGGNPAFSSYDLDSHLRLAFYPAVLGWILLSLWILDLRIRTRNIELDIQG